MNARGRSTQTLLAPLLAALLLVALSPAPAQARTSRAAGNPYALYNGCFGLRSAVSKRYTSRSGTGYTANSTSRGAFPLRFKPTALGRYLLIGPDKTFVGVDAQGAVSPASAPATATIWRVTGSRRGLFVLTSVSDGRRLTLGKGRRLVLARPDNALGHQHFAADRARGCTVPPEAQVNAHGKAFRGASSSSEVLGTIDAHTHLTAFEFIGGDFHCGRPWAPFGVTFALPDCASIQGPKGSAAPVQNFVDYGEPVHPHDTVGWPTFRDWPGPSKLSYEGTYYTGLKRAWLAGLRVMVTDLVDNEALCDIIPKKHNPCDDMASVHIQARDLKALENYVDAQSGGPGKGWLRIVTNPFQARAVVNQGKLAVVEGVEVSRIFHCGEHNHVSECSRAQVDAGLSEVRKLGVSSFYPVHKFDNAFGGTKMDGGATGTLINGGNHLKTGHFWNIKTCTGPAHDSQQLTPETGGFPKLGATPMRALLPNDAVPVYPPAPHCNQQGLTSLGEYVLNRMMDRHFIIEIDHMDVKTGDRALSLIEKRRYSGVVSPHNWSSPEQYPRIYRTGGFVNPIAGSSPEAFVSQWREDRKLRSPKFKFGFGYGSDINGLAHQSNATNAHPVKYPFRSHTGQVKFDKERWGQRVFDLNTQGLSSYGQYADWLQELQILGGRAMMKDMFTGSEAYLETWERAFGVPTTHCRPARESFGTSGLGRGLRLGSNVRALLLSAGQPSTRPGRSFRYCVKGGGRAATVFDSRGHTAFVASTASGDRAAGVAPGSSAGALSGRTVSVGGGVLASPAHGGTRFVYGVRGGRVRWVAAAKSSEARSVRRLRADVRAAGI